MHVVDGRIAWLGAAAEAPSADRTIAGEGALLTPAFVDAHVHATATGLALTGLDLHGEREPCATPSRPSPAHVGAHAARHRARHRLGRDRLAGGPRPDPRRPRRRRRRPAGLPGPGRRPLGHGLDRAARPRPRHHRAARATPPTAGCGSTPTTPPARPPTARSAPDQRRAAQRATLDAAAALGIGSAARDGRPGGLRRRGPRRRCSTLAARAARARGWSATGASWPSAAASTSSASWAWPAPGETCSATAPSARTPRRWAAALHRPAGHRRARCASPPGSWSHHVRACTRPASRPASTCIGDAAVDQVLYAVETVAAELGAAAVRACRHRLEHVEMVDRRRTSTRMRDLGMVASVQPAFDAAWGGDAGMYAERLGRRAGAGCQPVRRPRRRRGRRSRWAATPRSRRWTRGAACTPPSTTARRARGCARSTPSTPPPTAAGTPPAPSTRSARWPSARPADLALWATDADPVRRPGRARPAHLPAAARRRRTRSETTRRSKPRRSQPRPGAGRPGAGAGRARRAAGGRPGPPAHHRLRRARGAAAGRADRHRPGDRGGAHRGPRALGQPGGRRRPRPGRAWSPGSRCRSGTRSPPARRRPAGPRRAGRRRHRAVRAARPARDAERAREAAHAAAAAGHRPDRRQPARAGTSWSPPTATRRAVRGST